MTTSAPADLQLPFDRPGALDISPIYARLRAERPVAKVRTPAGDPAWLVTGYAETKQLFADPRLGRSHPEPEKASRISDAGVMGGPSGSYDTEQADHSRMRKLLLPAFSARRMRLLDEHVHQLVDDLIDRMVAAGSPADLHELLSVPLPIYVICELLGVPYADRDHFKGLSERTATMTGGDDARIAMGELMAYTAELAAQKRTEPGEDVISDLVAAQREDPDFDDRQLAMLAAGLLFAGHETTVNRISIGVLLLLENDDARRGLIEDPSTVNRVVEEVLRLAAPGDFGLARYAHSDIEVGEGEHRVTIAAGDAVILSTVASNRDDEAFADPERFDATRAPNAHLSFGHGAHFCIGASLARTELKAVFGTLFARLPQLRLATSADELRLHTERLTGGLYSLPVAF